MQADWRWSKEGLTEMAGESALWGQTKRVRSLLPGEGSAGPHLSILVLKGHLQRGRMLCLQNKPHEEDKVQCMQVGPRKVSSQYRKAIFYSEKSQLLEQHPQECIRATTSGGVQDAIWQGARQCHLGFLSHKRLDQMPFWGVLQAGLSYDCMILEKIKFTLESILLFWLKTSDSSYSL